MKQIAIRADGGREIGMGHIMRTMVLAAELKKNAEVFYVCKKDEKFLDGVEKLAENGFSVKSIQGGLKSLLQVDADFLITDSYDVNEHFFNETKKKFEQTMYIDDFNFLPYYNVDILLNQNIGAEDNPYKVNSHTRLLLGSRYTLLREEFRNIPPITIKKEVKQILFTTGGADPHNVTGRLLHHLLQLPFTFLVVVGGSFTHVSELKKMEKERENMILFEKPPMSAMMQKCDIAISACGSTIYELASLGIPTIGFIAFDNQEKVSFDMEKNGLIVNLGWYNKIDDNHLREVVTLFSDFSFRRQFAENQLQKVNTIGVLEVLRECSYLVDKLKD